MGVRVSHCVTTRHWSPVPGSVSSPCCSVSAIVPYRSVTQHVNTSACCGSSLIWTSLLYPEVHSAQDYYWTGAESLIRDVQIYGTAGDRTEPFICCRVTQKPLPGATFSCVCVCESERVSDRERSRDRDRERDRERESERERERFSLTYTYETIHILYWKPQTYVKLFNWYVWGFQYSMWMVSYACVRGHFSAVYMRTFY